MDYATKWLDNEETKLHLALDGQLQFGQFKDLQSYIFSLKEIPPKQITFDLSNVGFIDSSGLGLLMIAHEITGKSHNVTLKSPQKQVLQILEVCNIKEIMNIVQ